MNKFESRLVARLKPYTAGENPANLEEVIKLNTNENPYPPSPNVQKAMMTFDCDYLRRYPDSQSELLRQKLASNYGVTPEQIFVGNGSDEVLAFIFAAFFSGNAKKQPLLLPEISYSFYPTYCELWNVEYKKIPLKKFQIYFKNYLIERVGIVFANPNSPTGLAVGVDDIEKILQQNLNKLVVVDEAYVDFGAESTISLLNYPNLLIVKTFSKFYALAGIRLGYCIGAEKNIQSLTKLKNSFNSYPVDSIASRLGIAALSDTYYYKSIVEKITTARNNLTNQLQAMGLSVLPSVTNFVLVNIRATASYNAELIAKELKHKSILVRHFNVPLLKDYIRISIGKPKDNKKLLTELQTIIQSFS